MYAEKTNYMIGSRTPVLIAGNDENRKGIIIRNEVGTLDIFLESVNRDFSVRYTLRNEETLSLDSSWTGEIYAVKRCGTSAVYVVVIV